MDTIYQQFIHLSRYARWRDDLKRRETWDETVDRYVDNVIRPVLKDDPVIEEIRSAILNLEVMPSMRGMMTAGAALNRDNTCLFNCSYLVVDDLRAFDEAMFILLCGTGVGFSVERQYISKLPVVPEVLEEVQDKIIVEDSKEGWASAYRLLLTYLYDGKIPSWDTSLVRPAGSRLKTFGGRASGPGPLVDLFNFTIKTFKSAAGRKLTSIECHDILCKIGEIVVSGGVRRSAMLSLSNLSDTRMRHAKSGQWWETAAHRALSNNSVAYTEKPDMETFLREWTALVESKSGERGIFNRVASTNQAAKYGKRQTLGIEFGTNPCSEIILRPQQFCNLSETVVRATDTMETLKRKVRLATIIGTVQSTYTYFPYLREIWKKNTEEERLLGVSLTGIMDNPKLLSYDLSELREVAVSVNREYADRLGIPASAAITCVKPSGTVSQLVDSASGLHARHSPYYIRTVRGDRKDPMTKLMIDQGIPHEPCVMKPETTIVFSFPHKAPEGAITRNDLSALEQLDIWMKLQDEYTEHKPSVTISVRENEWLEVGAYVYKNFDKMSGVSFLPHSDHSYQQAPYQECSEEEYLALLAKMPKSIDWSKLSDYEQEDNTSGSQSLACSADGCEIVDLT